MQAPPGGGPIAEEQSFTVLSDGTLYCVYRTIDAYSACTYSYDGGHTWTEPEYTTYADGGRMKHPRAANFAWRCQNGKFLYWFHNHGGRQIREHPQQRIISFVVDGKFCDGGEYRQFGWGRFSPHLREANGGDTLRIGENVRGAIHSLGIYTRALCTAEAVSNFNVNR